MFSPKNNILLISRNNKIEHCFQNSIEKL